MLVASTIDCSIYERELLYITTGKLARSLKLEGGVVTALRIRSTFA